MQANKINGLSVSDAIIFDDPLIKDDLRSSRYVYDPLSDFSRYSIPHRAGNRLSFDHLAYDIRYQSFDSRVDDSRSWVPSSEAKAESLAFFLKPLVKKIRAASGIDKYFSQYSGCASPFFGFSEDDIARRKAHANLWEIYQQLESVAMEIPDWLIPNAHGKRGFGNFQC